MLSADFAERYQLVRQATEGSVRTFHAVAQTGAVVMVHMVDPEARDEHWRVLGLLDRLDPTVKERIVEVGEVDGGPVIVTRFLPDFDSLGQWLEAHGNDPRAGERAGQEPPALEPPAPKTGPPTPAPPASPPGEFTRLFREQTRPHDAATASPAEASPAEASSRDSSAKKPGEFTQLFRSPLLEDEPIEPVEAPLDPPAPAEIPRAEPGRTERPGPGEFTRWFARQTGPPPEEAASEEPGLSYGSRRTGGASGEPAHVDWRSRLAPDSPPADTSPPAGVEGFRPAHEPIPPAGADQPRPPAPVATGPGDYTRVLSGQPAPVHSAPSPAPLAPPPTPPPRGPSRALVVWGLAGIVLAAVVTVVLFALLARETPPPAEPTTGESQEAPANAPTAEPEAAASESGAGR